MTLQENTEYVGKTLDEFYALQPQFGVAADDNSSRGVPRNMWKGDVDDEGWVEWTISPSSLSLVEIKELEAHYGLSLIHI